MTLITVMGEKKIYPLHYACWGGHKDIVQYMVESLNCDAGEFNDYNNSFS